MSWTLQSNLSVNKEIRVNRCLYYVFNTRRRNIINLYGPKDIFYTFVVFINCSSTRTIKLELLKSVDFFFFFKRYPPSLCCLAFLETRKTGLWTVEFASGLKDCVNLCLICSYSQCCQYLILLRKYTQ